MIGYKYFIGHIFFCMIGYKQIMGYNYVIGIVGYMIGDIIYY